MEPSPPQPPPPPVASPQRPEPIPLPPRRSRLALAAFLCGFAGPIACGLGPFLALFLGAIAEARIKSSGGRLHGRTWIRAGVLLSLAWLALLWQGRDRIVSVVMTHVSSWEELPPLAPERAEEIERAIDRLSRFDMRSRVEGQVRIEQAGEAAVPHLVNRLGVLSGLGRIRLDRRVRNLLDSRERIRLILVTLTFHDFGLDAAAWRRWWEGAKDAARDDWALEALLSSDDAARRRALERFSSRRERDARVLRACLSLVREGDPYLRSEAYALLVGCADRDFGFDPSAPPQEQKAAIAAIERWIDAASSAGGVLIPVER